MQAKCKRCRHGCKTDQKGVRYCKVDGKLRMGKVVRNCVVFVQKTRKPAVVAASGLDDSAGQIRLFSDGCGQPRCSDEGQIALFSGSTEEGSAPTSDRDGALRLFKD